ncbi:MAG: hypothetical protein RIQ56_557, partial [Candidatus Parcubacteria bacterium]
MAPHFDASAIAPAIFFDDAANVST